MSELFNNDMDETECDFDKGPTNIWMLVEDRDWNGVIYQAKHFPKEARTFVFRSDATATSNNHLRWRMLPLHAAVLGDAPTSVLQSLLRAYRAGARATDDQGMLPIHLAIKKHADPERINVLLATFPECVDVKNNLGLRPIDMAKISSSEHKSYYLRATRRGTSTYSAVTNTLDDLLCGFDIRSVVPTSPLLLLSSK